MKKLAALVMVLTLLITPVFGTSTLADAEQVSISWYSDVSGWGPANWNDVETSPLMDAIEEKYPNCNSKLQ